MTNTYNDNDKIEIKIYEELRCLRCVLERILRELNEGNFVDYEMEKFGKDYKLNRTTDNPQSEDISRSS